MWILKAKVPGHEGQLAGSQTKKHGISAIGFTVAHNFENGKLLVTAVGHLVGEEKNKKAFLKEAVKDPRVINYEVNKDVVIAQFEQDPRMIVFYNPEVFFINPAITNEKGDNIFELASWRKEPLQKIANLFIGAGYNGNILSFKQQKIDNIFSLRALPTITEKQRRAFELAVQNGYYEQPRQIDLTKLAEIMKVSYTTYHYHLRSAEKKLLPLLN